MNKQEIEKKLEELREEYKNAPNEKKFSVQMKARPWQSALYEITLKEQKLI